MSLHNADGERDTLTEARALIDWVNDGDHRIGSGAGKRGCRRRRRPDLDEVDVTTKTLHRVAEYLRRDCANNRSRRDRTSSGRGTVLAQSQVESLQEYQRNAASREGGVHWHMTESRI